MTGERVRSRTELEKLYLNGKRYLNGLERDEGEPSYTCMHQTHLRNTLHYTPLLL